ncbi:MAG: acyltransferase family protein [Hyphomicrobium sp.]
MSTGRSVAVDAVRGLAAAIVLVHHVEVLMPQSTSALASVTNIGHSILKTISDLNTVAVMLFFLVSGFCIRSACLQSDFTRGVDIATYARARAARIMPLYLLAIAYTYMSGVAAGQTSLPSYSIVNLIGNIFFLQSPASARGTWFAPYGDNGPLWSLSFEAFYYCLFPMFAVLFGSHKGNRGSSSLTGLFYSMIFSAAAFASYQASPNPISLFATFFCVWWLGLCIFDAQQGQLSKARLSAMTGCALAALLALLHIAPSATMQMVCEGLLLGLGWIAFMAVPWSKHSHEFSFGCVLRSFAALGSISYALYLFHYPTLRLVKLALGDTGLAVFAGVAGSLAMAVAFEGLADRFKQVTLPKRTMA